MCDPVFEISCLTKYIWQLSLQVMENILQFTKFYGCKYIDTLKQELSGTKAYEQTYEKEKSFINNHIFHNATRFVVSVNEGKERLPTFYWLLNCTNNHKMHDVLLILAHARLPKY